MRCLLVIPAFRESGRLPAFLRELLGQLEREELDCEVLVVDDGSGAEEQRALRECAARLRRESPRLLDPLCFEKNRGKGAAIRAGWECVAGHDWVGFVDADGAIPAREVCRLLRLAAESRQRAPVFAARIRMLGRHIERRGLRHLTGRLFAGLVGLGIAPGIYDSQCGLKLIPAERHRQIAPWLAEDGFCFDVELLAALLASGAAVSEVPIDWSDVPGSKVRLFHDTARMVLGLCRIFQRKKIWMSSNADNSHPSGLPGIGTIARNLNCSSRT